MKGDATGVVKSLGRNLRSGMHIILLFSALVMTPLLALSHFNIGLAGMLGSFAENYLPRPTLFSSEKKARMRSQAKLREQRIFDAGDRAKRRQMVAATRKSAGNNGRRILQRGAGAMAVGWVPVIGMTADVVSLGADYSDICSLYATIDELSASLYLPDSNLYGDNYCDVPEQGIELLQESAASTHFPWEIEGEL